MFLSSKDPILAVDIGSYSIQIAQLRQKHNRYELECFGSLPTRPEALVEGVIKNPDAVVETLRELLKAENIKTRYVVSSVAGETVIIKKMKLPSMSLKKLKKRIYEEAERYIPLDFGDANMDFQLMRYLDASQPPSHPGDEGGDQKRPTMEVLLVGVQRRVIETRTEILGELGLKPVIMDLDLFAMVNAVGISCDLKSLGAVLLADLGDSFTHIHLVDNGISYFTKDFRKGGKICTQKLQSKFQVSNKEAQAVKQGRLPINVDKKVAIEIMRSSLDPVFNEIENAIMGFEDQTGRKVQQVILSGGGALASGTKELFYKELKVPIKIYDPMKYIQYDRKKFNAQCIADIGPWTTVCFGLATRRFNFTNP